MIFQHSPTILPPSSGNKELAHDLALKADRLDPEHIAHAGWLQHRRTDGSGPRAKPLRGGGTDGAFGFKDTIWTQFLYPDLRVETRQLARLQSPSTASAYGSRAGWICQRKCLSKGSASRGFRAGRSQRLCLLDVLPDIRRLRTWQWSAQLPYSPPAPLNMLRNHRSMVPPHQSEP